MWAKRIISIAPLCILLLVTSCAPKHHSPAIRSFDHKLNCDQLERERFKLRDSKEEVAANLGKPEINMASELYWIANAEYAYYTAEQVLPLIEERLPFIETHYKDKDCKRILHEKAMRKKKAEKELKEIQKELKKALKEEKEAEEEAEKKKKKAIDEESQNDDSEESAGESDGTLDSE